jgi:hypothetical protein
MVGFIEPEGGWIDKWLTIRAEAICPQFLLSQKHPDPFVVALIFRQSLEGRGRCILKVARHII